jgi:hypothetical protein
MIERRSVSRLRNAGTVGALAIIGVLVLQATILIVLSMTAQPPSRSVNASGLRRAYTIRILYDATVHNEADLHNTIAALSASQARFGDLTPDQSEIFSRFLTTPNQADGQPLPRCGHYHGSGRDRVGRDLILSPRAAGRSALCEDG